MQRLLLLLVTLLVAAASFRLGFLSARPQPLAAGQGLQPPASPREPAPAAETEAEALSDVERLRIIDGLDAEVLSLERDLRREKARLEAAQLNLQREVDRLNAMGRELQ